MKTIALDTGIEEFQLQGGGVLRFNPGDPNLYARFLEAEAQLQALEKEMTDQLGSFSGSDRAAAIVRLTAETDKKVKALLDRVFGGDNDFDKALGGVNLLAVAADGERVAAKLFAALEEILSEGAARFAGEKAAQIRNAQ